LSTSATAVVRLSTSRPHVWIYNALKLRRLPLMCPSSKPSGIGEVGLFCSWMCLLFANQLATALER